MSRLVAKGSGNYAKYTIDGIEVQRVSSIVNALPKNALVQWAATEAANFAIEHWSELAEQPTAKRLDAIRYAHRNTNRKATTRGSRIHAFGEDIVNGHEVQIPDEDLGPAQAYARFLDDWEIEPFATEAPVAHTRWGYAGRTDLFARIGARDNERALIDLKTGSGVYESHVIQLAGYRFAEIWQPDGAESEAPLPPVDSVYVAHIMTDAVRLVPVTVRDEDFRVFLYLQQVAKWLDLHAGREPREPLIHEALSLEGLVS